jgi:predicted nucleic acid-binding protein
VKALFDTNILIDYLKGIDAAQAELARHRQPLISIVTWMEVLAGVRTDEESDVVEMFLRASAAASREFAEAKRSSFAAEAAAKSSSACSV